MWESIKWLITWLTQLWEALIRGLLDVPSRPQLASSSNYSVEAATRAGVDIEPSLRNTRTTTSKNVKKRNAGLCSYCSNVVNQWMKIVQGRITKFPHCKNFFALESSAQAGCSLCAQFLDDKDTETLSRYRAVTANALASETFIVSEVSVKHDPNEREQPWRLLLDIRTINEEGLGDTSYPSCQFCVLLFSSSKFSMSYPVASLKLLAKMNSCSGRETKEIQ
jgi:hypothetical protein